MRKYNFLIILVAVLSLFFLLKKGFENKTDVLWQETEKLVTSKSVFLSDKKTELQELYNNIHSTSKTNAIELISDPFLPSLSWKKFKNLVYKVYTERKVIIVGTSGTGKSTLIDKIALIITGNKSQITKINCIEGLESEFYSNNVGYYHTGNSESFEPGKLLRLLKKCENDPEKNYVFIIDDIDKVYRSKLLGSALWDELDNSDHKNTIEGYKHEIKIPENLYIITTSNHSGFAEVPLTASDYRRFTVKNNPYILEPNQEELKQYLQKNNINQFSSTSKKELTQKLYYFSKINQVISEKIGNYATLGNWSGIQKVLVNNDFKAVENFIKTDLTRYEKVAKLTQKDYDNIIYSIHHNGKLKGSNLFNTFLNKLITLGIISELTVALLFALFSFLSFTRTNIIRKNNIDSLLDDINFIEKKYLDSVIDYNYAFGNLLSIKDDIQFFSKKGKLNFAQANYLMRQFEETSKVIDFVNKLELNNDELSNFMKKVISDDNITEEEYKQHIKFLDKSRNNINLETYQSVKQQLIKLYYKSKVKHGRD